MNTLLYALFAALVLSCTVVVAGFIAVAWVGWTPGLLWMAVAAPFMLFIVYRLYRSTRLGGGPP